MKRNIIPRLFLLLVLLYSVTNAPAQDVGLQL